MKRNDFNLCKKEIRRLLKRLDDSFVPNHVYQKGSVLYRDASHLRYVVDCLCSDLIH